MRHIDLPPIFLEDRWLISGYGWMHKDKFIQSLRFQTPRILIDDWVVIKAEEPVNLSYSA